MSKMVNSRPRSMDNGRQTGSAPDQSLLLDAALQAVNWRKRQILCFVAVAFALALLLIHNSTPRYTATAGLITETSRATPSPADRGPEGVIDNTIIESQTAIIKSDSVALAVIDKLKLWEDPEFVGPGGGSLSRIAGALGFYRAPIGKADKNDGIRKQSALEGFQRALNVTRVGRSYVVEVSFTSNDSEKSAKIANAVAEAYINDQLNAKLDASRRAVEWMQQRLVDLRISAARGKQDPLTPKLGEASSAAEEISGNIAEFNQLTAALDASRTETAKIRRQLEVARYGIVSRNLSPNGEDVTFPEDLKALNDPALNELLDGYAIVVAKLKSADSDSSEPSSDELRTERVGMANSIRLEVRRLTEGYEKDFKVALANENSIEERRAALLQVEAQKKEGQERLGQIEDQTNKSIYQDFLTHYIEALRNQSFPGTEARIVSRAAAPLKAGTPKTSVILLLATLSGLLIALMVATAQEYFGRPIRSSAQVEKALGIESLGTLTCIETAHVPFRKSNRFPLLRFDTDTATQSDAFRSEVIPAGEELRSVKLAIEFNCRLGAWARRRNSIRRARRRPDHRRL